MLACPAMRLRIAPFAVALTTFAASACGGSDSPTPGPTTDLTYGISGTVRGLTGKGLVVQLNGADPVFVSAGTGASPVTFAFAKKLTMGTVYEVKVANQPTGPDQVCTVTNGNGTVRDRNIADVDITCAQSAAPVSGTASGIENGTVAVITLNGGNDLALTPSVSGYPNWTFAAPVAFGAPYTVAVKTAPAGKTRGIENGTGTIAGPVTNVAVTCGLGVGGTVLGLAAGQTVTLANGTDELALTTASAGFPKFKFNRPVDSGKTYAVTIKTQPPGRRCIVRNGAGTMAMTAIDNVEVDCRCNPTALLLGAGTAFEAAFNAAVQADGFTVTSVPNYVSYAGQPDAAGFGTTVAFFNNTNATLPDPGQQSVLTAAAAGSGFVVNGWAHYRAQAFNTEVALRNLYLFNARYTEYGNVNLSVAATTPNHPLLSGIVFPFSMTASPYYMPAQPPVAGSTVIATEQNVHVRPVVAVRESVAAEGRRVNFTIDPFYGADRITADPKLLRLYLNAIKWSAHCE